MNAQRGLGTRVDGRRPATSPAARPRSAVGHSSAGAAEEAAGARLDLVACIEALLQSIAEARSIAGEASDLAVRRRLERVVDMLDAEAGAVTEAAGAARRETRAPRRRGRGVQPRS